MSSFRRFFREHLLRYLPQNLGGFALLMLAGLCQGLLIMTLKFVFTDNFRMGGAATDNLAALARAKAWLMSVMPVGSALQSGTYFIPAFLVFVFFIKGLFSYSGTLLMVRSGLRATQSLRERLFQHILTLEARFFQKHPVGELLTRCVTDVGAVQGIASNQLAEAMREITTALSMTGWLFYMNW
ncbi:MAG TPA: ABC transporter transmembrane domain-containing protein, partial [Holophagaceae bacterium]|nr:ABC transporter transmembrane domain-containing protein [Holophagaceae bacterium]